MQEFNFTLGDLMSGNSIGKLFTVTTFGESHGPALGCIIDGCPPGMELSVDDFRPDLDRRKPGTSKDVSRQGAETQSAAALLGFVASSSLRLCAFAGVRVKPKKRRSRRA